MTRIEAKQHLLTLLRQAKGDDLERAWIAFSRCSPEALDQHYGESGRTRREILTEYTEARAKWQAAYDLAEQID